MDMLAARDPLASEWLAATDPFITVLPALTKLLLARLEVVTTALDPVLNVERNPEPLDDRPERPDMSL